MPPDRVVYDAVLDAAGDVARADNALEAELLASAMLGSVYAMAETDRLLMVREFVGNFLAGTARRRSAVAVAVRAAFAALVPDAPGAGEVAPGPQAPPWVGQLGRVRPTGAYAYGDVYGDQTSYLVTFAYEKDAGGPEHVVVVLVDHNLGAVKDLFVGSATEVVAQARQLCASDDLVWFEDSVPVERVRAEVDRHLAYTDSLEVLPPEDSLAEDRAVVGARLALLPAGDGGPAPDDAPDRLDDA
ncbi:MAG TPA: hypothetical protein VFT95_05685, partial [Micromonosporaceae bacterium]|nr:hypothetical protein [Micromonosporaceae bacterium]